MKIMVILKKSVKRDVDWGVHSTFLVVLYQNMHVAKQETRRRKDK